MRAIVLAGGKGTRLAPYTTILPKPLMPIDDKPILEIVLRQLASAGFTDITLAVGYLSELIMAYFGDGGKWGIHLTYSHEDQPLGTAGPIAQVSGLEDTFLVMNGDLLTSIDFAAMLASHKARHAAATVASYRRDIEIDLGVLHLDADQWVTEYIEKPTYSFQVSTGIYIFEPSILAFIPRAQRFDLPELILALIRKGEKVSGFCFDGYWLDIGRHDDYEKATKEFCAHREVFLPKSAPAVR
jgi:NDP-mannose synthase